MSACATRDGEEPVGETSQALNGSLTTFECFPDEVDKLEAALDVIGATLGTAEYLSCAKAAFINYERRDVMAEDMITLLRARTTKVRCVAPGTCGDDALACAVGAPRYPSTVSEVMWIHTDTIESETPERLAAIMVHEAAHTTGFQHPDDGDSLGYPWSANVQMATCLLNGVPDGWSRDEKHGDNETAPVGGGGGQPFLLRCAAGSRVVGITASTSTFVNRIQLHCSNGTSTGTAGELKDSTQTTRHDCLQGKSLVSSYTVSDTMVRYLITQCAADAELIAENPTPAKDSQVLGGAPTTGTFAIRSCPTGMAIVGAAGRAGARIDQLRWLCQDINGTPALANPYTIGFRGTKTGNGKQEMCAGNGAIRGLYGHVAPEVNMLGAECMATRTDAAGDLGVIPESRHGLDFNGDLDGSPFERPCPASMVVVGLHVRSGARIDAIAPICSDAAHWAAGISPLVTVRPALAGATTGTESDLQCPNRSFVTGLRTWATEYDGTVTIHGVEPFCRRLTL